MLAIWRELWFLAATERLPLFPVVFSSDISPSSIDELVGDKDRLRELTIDPFAPSHRKVDPGVTTKLPDRLMPLLVPNPVSVSAPDTVVAFARFEPDVERADTDPRAPPAAAITVTPPALALDSPAAIKLEELIGPKETSPMSPAC